MGTGADTQILRGEDLGIYAKRATKLLQPLFANNLRAYFAPATTDEDKRNLHLARCLRQRFHRDLLVPLHERAKVPETFIGRQAFHKVNYDRMSSMCRTVHGLRVFRKNDQQRYDAVLEAAVAQMYTKVMADPQYDKEVVKTGALLPHEIIRTAEERVEGESGFEKVHSKAYPLQLEMECQWLGCVRCLYR